MLRELAASRIKPLLSDSAWQSLRHLDPDARRRDEAKARRRAAARKAAAERAAREAELQRREDALLARETEIASRADLSTKNLTWLAKHFKTDKWGRHRYTPHYQHHLRQLKNKKFTLLEIGIGGYSREKAGGASLRMWKAFFPQAHVVGLDIEDKSFVDEDRIRTVMGSQVDETLLRSLVAEMDDLAVIIDDGSHRCDHIIETFRILFPLLPDGGVYVIEDTQTSYWPRYGGSPDPDAKDTTMGLVRSLVDGLNYEEFTDPDYEPTHTELHIVGLHVYHNLVFIEKGRNEEGTTNRGKNHRE